MARSSRAAEAPALFHFTRWVVHEERAEGRRGDAKPTMGEGSTLAAGTQELLDLPQDRVPVRHLADHHVLLLLGQLRDVVVELAAAIRAFDLPVPEEIQLRQHLLREQLHAL